MSVSTRGLPGNTQRRGGSRGEKTGRGATEQSYCGSGFNRSSNRNNGHLWKNQDPGKGSTCGELILFSILSPCIHKSKRLPQKLMIFYYFSKMCLGNSSPIFSGAIKVYLPRLMHKKLVSKISLSYSDDLIIFLE